jgi:hypothetical protein
MKAWHFRLWNFLVSGHTLASINRVFEDVSFVVFNYDRCLEHFFYLALQGYFGIEPNIAAEIVGNIKIMHPYGQTGYLPWQCSGTSVDFGQTDRVPLDVISEELQTFTEVVDSAKAQQIKEAIYQADTVIFLGYGFLPQNNALLTPDLKSSRASRFFATVYGLSGYDQGVANKDIFKILRNNTTEFDAPSHGLEATFDGGYCATMLSNNSLRLTRG